MHDVNSVLWGALQSFHHPAIVIMTGEPNAHNDFDIRPRRSELCATRERRMIRKERWLCFVGKRIIRGIRSKLGNLELGKKYRVFLSHIFPFDFYL